MKNLFGGGGLATVSREPGQALIGAAISGVALCEGHLPQTETTSFCLFDGLLSGDHLSPQREFKSESKRR